MTLTLRQQKGERLTNAEVDANFEYLDQTKIAQSDLRFAASFFVPESLSENETMAIVVLPRAILLEENLPLSQFFVQVPPQDTNATVDILRNGSTIGSVLFEQNSGNTVIDFQVDVACAAGDRIEFVNRHDNANAGFSGVAITLTGIPQ